MSGCNYENHEYLAMNHYLLATSFHWIRR